MTKTMLVLHLGGVDSLSRLSGIHGHHLNQFQYTATDSENQTIISIDAPGPNGTTTEYVSSDWKDPIKGIRRTMDCMDCHNQAAHSYQPRRTRLMNRWPTARPIRLFPSSTNKACY
jgi:hypothetical protein